VYKPSEVKQWVTSYGRGSKEQVGMMVQSLLGMSEPATPADAADALAIALCHSMRRGANEMLAARRDDRADHRRCGGQDSMVVDVTASAASCTRRPVVSRADGARRWCALTWWCARTG
jgi:hypothetical protein